LGPKLIAHAAKQNTELRQEALREIAAANKWAATAAELRKKL
jgi:hypothetical protein